MVFWIQSDVNILDTVTLDTVELASDCIQQLKQKLKLNRKQRLKNQTPRTGSILSFYHM